MQDAVQCDWCKKVVQKSELDKQWFTVDIKGIGIYIIAPWRGFDFCSWECFFNYMDMLGQTRKPLWGEQL